MNADVGIEIVKPRKKKGGAMPGAGRPPIHGVPMKMINIRLTPEQREFAEQVGDGNCAEGIRSMIEQAMTVRGA